MSEALPGPPSESRFAFRSLKNPALLKIDPTLFLLVAMIAVDDVSGVDEVE